MKFNINKLMLPMKGHYFLWNAGTSPVVPFISTYAKQLGFSSFIVGVIYTVLPVTGMLAKPLFGALADRYQCQKLLFMIFQLLTAFAFLSVNFIPDVPMDSGVHFTCTGVSSGIDTFVRNKTIDDKCAVDKIILEANKEIVNCNLECDITKDMWTTVCQHWSAKSCENINKNDLLKFSAQIPSDKTWATDNVLYFEVANVTLSNGETVHPYCPTNKAINNHVSAICEMTCHLPIINDYVAKPKLNDEDVTSVYQFWLFFALLIFSWVGMAVVVSVGDAICFQMLGDKPSKYGNQRLWGAVGWGIFSIITGLVVDSYSVGQIKKNYSPAFFMCMIILLLDFVASYHLKYTQKKISASIMRDVGRLLSDLRILIFIVWCVSVGLCTALIWQFLFWYLEDLASQQGCDMYGWIKTLEGLAMAIQCLGGELPFFFISGWLLKRIGHINAMNLVLLAFGVRFILYSYLTNPWWCLPIEMSNGITFGIFYATMASYASIVAPPGTEATVQGLVGAVFEGVGVSLGSLIAGYFYDEYGGSKTFRIFGISALVVCLVHGSIQYLLQKRNLSQDFETAARYASPNEAIHMVEEDFRDTI